ncbi:MAG: polysaccharide biosynthesis tyrosine autokinase [Verrucomicrobiota bacterium]
MNTLALTTPDLARDGSPPIDTEQLGIIFRENLWLLVCTGLLGIGIVFSHLKQVPDIYSATTVLQITQRHRVLSFETTATTTGSDSEIQTTLELLRSRPLLLEAATKLGLANDPDFAPNPISTETAADILRGILQIRQRRGSELLDITVTHTNGAVASRIANGIAEAFLSFQNQRRADNVRSIMDSLITEADRLKARLQKSEETLQTYIENNNAVSLEEKQDTVTSALKAQANNLISARSNRIRLQTDLADMERFRYQVPQLLTVASIAQHPAIISQRNLINELLSKAATLKLRYTEKHPKLIQVRQQLADAESTLQRITLQIPSTLKAELERAVATERSFETALRDQEKQSLTLSRQSMSYSVLARDMETDRGLYQSILRRLKETDIERGIPAQNVQILETALIPTSPQKPKQLQFLLLGLGIGIAGGAAIIFLRQFVSGRLHSSATIEDITQLSVLTSIPKQPRQRLWGARSKSASVQSQRHLLESFRSLRIALQLSAQRHGKHCFLFTSPLPGEGKSFSATGYATVLANQGLRTLLIDADLRNPSLERMLLTKGANQGLVGILENKLSLLSAILPTNTPNLDLLPAGPLSSNSAELLLISTIEKLITEAKSHYDCIIIDSPPVLPVSDAVLLSTVVDAVCIVARYGKTTQKTLRQTIQLLEEAQAPIEGIIFNAVSATALPRYPSYSPQTSLLRL